MSEEVDLVDEQDRVIGSSTVKGCLEGGLLHRAVAVLVVRKDGKLVLQQRSRRDLWQPGQWTLSSTGHVKRKESYDAAASRELFEELGIRARPHRLKKYLLPPITAAGLTEREWVTLYVARSDSQADTDPLELEGIKEISPVELKELLAKGGVTPDASFLLKEYLGAHALGD
jgi:isopentenyl-diphosphate Delta-isomerase